MPLKSGTLLRNRYRIETVLGQGGMGAVYRAVDSNLGVTVAVKENLFTTTEFATQFVREARILANLRHSSLPRVTDHFVVEGEGQYLVMDFVAGEDLRERLERSGEVAEEEALPWFLDICEALGYLHTRMPPILHRDVKPGNIKLTPDGRGVLVDFGLAKVVEGTGTTTTGAKAMTPGFSPPEQYGTGRTDPRTDVYSLAATMYAAFTARIPEDALERAMGREHLTPLRQRNPDVSGALSRAIEKALDVRPDDRYQTMAEFAAALRAASTASRPTLVRGLPRVETPSTRPPPPVTPVPPPRPPPTLAPQAPSSGRLWPLLLVGIIGVLAVFGTITLLPSLSGWFGGGTASPASTRSPVPTQPDSLIVPPIGPTETGEFVEPTGTVPSVAPTAGATPVGGGTGELAFASNRSGVAQIYLVNFDGSETTQLTSVRDGACQPAWSPDGTRLAFISPCSANRETYPNAQIFLMNIDGSGLTPLQTVPGGDFDPTWSPDGKRIAFTSMRDQRAQIYEYVLETNQVRNLSSNPAAEMQPSWSPSGEELLFVGQRLGETDIWIMSGQGGSPKRITRGGSSSHPHWSRTGSLVLFDLDVGSVPRLAAAPFTGEVFVSSRICTSGTYAGYPMSEGRLSPDQQWVAFETWPSGSNHEVAVMTINCTNFRILTEDSGLDFDPAWRR